MERIPEGTLLSVPGWSGAALAAGLKPSGGLDLALLHADGPRTVAGVFTRNELPAAPVLLCRERLAKRAEARNIVINAGIANAMTGEQGMEAASAMARRVEERCGGPALVLSTGVIGVQLPLDMVLEGIDQASDRLSSDRQTGDDIAAAMLTTDSRKKTLALRVTLPAPEGGEERSVTVAGVAKGAGMIHPNMATMLAIVTTDAPVGAAALEGILRRTVDRSFHEISVDGDTSTNDTVLLLAGGAAMPVIEDGDPRAAALEAAIAEVMRWLASEIVHDGEGVSRVLDLHVTGARTPEEARRVAEAIARSPLVKTALAGGDPNWGRILGAAANAGVPLRPERIELRLGGLRVFADGLPQPADLAALEAAFRQRDVLAELELGRGDASARLQVADLTKDYVQINSEYTT